MNLIDFNRMVTLTAGMPRLRKDDFVFEDEADKDEYKYRKRQQEARKALGLYSFRCKQYTW